MPLVQAADVINLHWVAYYQSPVTLHRLLDLGKPVVWTLHDQWGLTGGCHIATRCERYRHDCHPCPQLADDPFNLPKAVLRDKVELFSGADLTIVTPSQWLATCATESRLFKDAPVLVIPNSVETDVFAPLPKAQAREALALPLESVVLLFGATDVKEKLKGFRELRDALQHCLAHPEFQRLVDDDKIRLLCFGHSSEELRPGRIPTTPLGYVASEETMRFAYAAADVFILPSLEDNLPNTMLEAMSCGTPVVAFAVGGIPDVVVDGVTGRLAPPGDVRSLGDAILALVFNSDERELMGQNCRKAMVDGYSPQVQARRYLESYQELCEGSRRSAQAARRGRAGERPDAETLAGSEIEISGVCVDTTLGTHFQEIYDKVLSKALREFCPAREKAYQASEADRAARLEQMNELTRLLQGSEADRAARLEQINRLADLLQESEADRAARLETIREQGRRLGELEGERNDLGAQLEQLERHFVAAEADRAARLEVIHEQQRKFMELHDEIENLQAALTAIADSSVYKVLRRLGRWAHVEKAIAGIRSGRASPHEQVSTAGTGERGARDSEAQVQALLDQYEAAGKNLFSIYESYGLHITPVHYYSCIPEVSALTEQLWEEISALAGIELNESAQLRFLEKTCPTFKTEYDAFPYEPTEVPYQYYLNQEMFRAVDAEVLHCIIRHCRPQRIIEVGSGFSTYVIAAAAVANAEEGHQAQVTVIDPYPNDVVRQGFPGLSSVLPRRVQDTNNSLFTSLTENDVLFVDSSHVLRIDSDVRSLVLEVLPRLRPGVLVHFHDIFLPLHYPREWVVQEHRFWTEQYLLQAFLAFNRDFEVVWAGSHMHVHHSDALALAFSSYDPLTVWPGSFWISRAGNNRLAE